MRLILFFLCFAASYYGLPPNHIKRCFLFSRWEKWKTIWWPAFTLQLQGQAWPWKSEQPRRWSQCTQQLQGKRRARGGEWNPAEACALHLWGEEPGEGGQRGEVPQGGLHPRGVPRAQEVESILPEVDACLCSILLTTGGRAHLSQTGLIGLNEANLTFLCARWSQANGCNFFRL